MANKNYKSKFKLVVAVVSASAFVFLILFLLGKVKYGDRISIVSSNDYYMNTNTRKINSEDIYKQDFEYNGRNLYSVKLKYAVQGETPDAYWSVQLYNDNELVQQWDERYENVTDGEIKEYLIDAKHKCDSEKYAVVVCTEYAGESEVYLYGSDTNTYLSGDLYIDKAEQEGDITLVISEISDVKVTLVYSILLSVLLGTIIVLAIYKKWYLKILAFLEECKNYVVRNKKEIMMFSGACLVALIILLVIRKMTHMGVPFISRFSVYHYAFLLAVAINGIAILSFRKTIEKMPEILVCLNILVIGIMYIFVLPADAEISWDEAIHFWRTIGVANSTTGMANEAESLLYWKSGIPFSLPNSPGNLVGAYQTVENLYQQSNLTGANTEILTSIIGVAYIPAAILINVGKLFGFKLWHIFKLGLVGMLLTYVANVYFAMKKVVSGKMIVATVSCIGTAFFLATVYSSDSWIMGFSILGFAYFIGCMQKEEQITNKELVIMVLSLTIAFFPKAVYFPMLLVLVLLPKDKFLSEEQHRKFIAAIFASITILGLGVAIDHILVVLLWIPLYFFYRLSVKIFLKMNVKTRVVFCAIGFVIMLVLAYFALNVILPMVIGEGDIRGGDTVNPAAQLVGIVNNPMEYIILLKDFIFGRYLSFKDSLKLVFEQYGYLGTSGFHYIGVTLVVVACLTDKDKNDCFKRINLTRITTVLVILFTIVLISTALYISFTPVGFYTVIGCQPRYLLPLIYPLLAVVGSGRLKNPIKKVYYNTILIIGINGYLLINILKLAVVRYHV